MLFVLLFKLIVEHLYHLEFVLIMEFLNLFFYCSLVELYPFDFILFFQILAFIQIIFYTGIRTISRRRFYRIEVKGCRFSLRTPIGIGICAIAAVIIRFIDNWAPVFLRLISDLYFLLHQLVVQNSQLGRLNRNQIFMFVYTVEGLLPDGHLLDIPIL